MDYDVIQDLNQMRLKNEHCDATLRNSKGTQSFPVHQVVLLAMSPRFKEVFATDKANVVIPNVSCKAIEVLIEYAYLRQIRIETNYVWDLMALADRFDIPSLSGLCLDYVSSNMKSHNCLRSYKYARKTKVKALRDKVSNFVLDHFPEIDKHDANFTELAFPQVASLLCNPRLNANEEEVWEAALAWYDFDPETRKLCMLGLLECVRLVFLNKKFFFERVICHEEIMKQDDCRIFILNRYRFLTDLPLVATVDMEDIRTPDMGLPRYPYDIMFVIGGCSNGKSSNQMCTYDRKADFWKKLSFGDKFQPRAYHVCVTIDKNLYVIGGRDEFHYLQTCQCFDVVKKIWKEIAPLSMSRSSLCATVLDGCIYAISGSDADSITNTTERYDPEENEWYPSAELNEKRVRAAAVTSGDYIFVAGGYNGKEYLHSMESYKESNNCWSFMSPMNEARSELCMTVYRGNIYAVGGYNGDQVLRSAEKYDRLTDTWTYIPEMRNPRCQFVMAVLDDRLVVAGGINPHEMESQLVEKYDETTNEWNIMGDCEIGCTAACGHSVVSDLYDQLDDYTLQDRNAAFVNKVHYIARMKRRKRYDEIFRALSLFMI